MTTTGRAPAAPADLPPALAAAPRLAGWLRIGADGTVLVRSGKVEIGQGVLTALAQIVAEELEVEPARVWMAPVTTGTSPDEGYTAGSLSVQNSGAALRVAAAEARLLLVEAAAQQWGLDPAAPPVPGARLDRHLDRDRPGRSRRVGAGVVAHAGPVPAAPRDRRGAGDRPGAGRRAARGGRRLLRPQRRRRRRHGRGAARGGDARPARPGGLVAPGRAGLGAAQPGGGRDDRGRRRAQPGRGRRGPGDQPGAREAGALRPRPGHQRHLGETYPVLRFSDVPAVEVELVPGAGNPALGVGEMAQGPTAAAIGNALCDAIGVRVRTLPLTPQNVAAAIPD